MALGLCACEPDARAADAAQPASGEQGDAATVERSPPEPDAAAPNAGHVDANAAPMPALSPERDAGSAPDAAMSVVDAAAEAEDAAAQSDAGLCADGFPRGVASGVTRLVQKLNPGPEGVGVCPNGDVLASAGEVLWRLPIAGGDAQKLSTLPGRSLESIVCDANGRIFVADISPMWALFALQEPAYPPAVMLLEEHGAKAHALTESSAGSPQLTGFNGLLSLPGLGLYTTDMLAGVIVRYQEQPDGSFTSNRVADDLPGANGLAYDAKKRVLYVVQTGMVLTPDRVWAFDMNADGSLGRRTPHWLSHALNGSDGLAIDEHGVLYRADQLHGQVVRMSDETVVAKVPNPASLAFRGGTLFISDFKMLGPLQNGGEGGVYAVDLGVCGADLPAP